MKKPSRLDAGLFGRWWWSVDHVNLAIVGVIIGIGLSLIMAAGPVTASRLSHVDVFHFTIRQLIFLVPAVGVMVGMSLLTPLQVRRVGVLVFVGALMGLIAVQVAGSEINGAKRWLDLGPLLWQPSEFAKSGFVIAAAWMLAEGARDKAFPGGLIALGLYLVLSALLLLQPDVGQWMLVTMVWSVMFFIAGWSWLWLGLLALLGMGAFFTAYRLMPHVADRIDGFLKPEAGDNYQVDKAVEAIASGGPFGKGAAEASVKHSLPDAHADFIFAVGGEEFGFFFCAVIILLFLTFVVRAFLRALLARSVFVQCAICGLAAVIGFQAIINIGVNLRALPAKGMTLPFISYGGSSLIATAFTVGCILALTRRQAGQTGLITRRREVLA